MLFPTFPPQAFFKNMNLNKTSHLALWDISDTAYFKIMTLHLALSDVLVTGLFQGHELKQNIIFVCINS